MKITTYNLWHGLNARGTLEFERLEPLARTLNRNIEQLRMMQKSDSQIFFFQEVNPLRLRIKEFEKLGFEVHAHADNLGLKLFGFGFPSNLKSGLVIALKKPSISKLVMALKLSGTPLSVDSPLFSLQLKENRYALLVETFVTEIGRVLLVNTHLHHGPEFTTDLKLKLLSWSESEKVPSRFLKIVEKSLLQGEKRRLAEVDLLLKTLLPLKSEYDAIVLGGDLNFSPNSPLKTKLIEFGFVDSCNKEYLTFDSDHNTTHLLTKDFELPVKVAVGTPGAKKLRVLLTNHDQRPRRIDYVFVFSGSHRVKEISSHLVKSPTEIEVSDHYGVEASVEFVK